MDNDFLNDSNGVFENENDFRWRLSKRYIRDWENPIEFFKDITFRKRYRFSKRVVIDLLLPLINNELRRTDNRGLPISPIMQLLIILRFYATSSFQVYFIFFRQYVKYIFHLLFITAFIYLFSRLLMEIFEELVRHRCHALLHKCQKL